ncbi:Insulin-induced gene 1 protein [Galemys pyrenaicus]|uniref:Insulin-induced gene 1 protein n=1 Tax=Galemys pyrenaicus TaxID=202257 RepID=A0A8J6DF45_GALPY|nr:Insulin-induced gene 1 protein [Galemys pyrenaicus]
MLLVRAPAWTDCPVLPQPRPSPPAAVEGALAWVTSTRALLAGRRYALPLWGASSAPLCAQLEPMRALGPTSGAQPASRASPLGSGPPWGPATPHSARAWPASCDPWDGAETRTLGAADGGLSCPPGALISLWKQNLTLKAKLPVQPLLVTEPFRTPGWASPAPAGPAVHSAPAQPLALERRGHSAVSPKALWVSFSQTPKLELGKCHRKLKLKGVVRTLAGLLHPPDGAPGLLPWAPGTGRPIAAVRGLHPWRGTCGLWVLSSRFFDSAFWSACCPSRGRWPHSPRLTRGQGGRPGLTHTHGLGSVPGAKGLQAAVWVPGVQSSAHSWASATGQHLSPRHSVGSAPGCWEAVLDVEWPPPEPGPCVARCGQVPLTCRRRAPGQLGSSPSRADPRSLAAVVGLLYPCIDSHLGEPHKFKREWASVMRCVAVFVGINHASAVSLDVVTGRPVSGEHWPW